MLVNINRYPKFQFNIIWYHRVFKQSEAGDESSLEICDAFAMVMLEPTEKRIDRFNQACLDYRMGQGETEPV